MIAGLTGKTMFNFVKKLTNYLQKEGEGEVTYSCPTLCDSVDCSLPGSSVHEIFQARVLEWVASAKAYKQYNTILIKLKTTKTT